MHSIERYGIVALLFLVVTVVAVLMWDGGKGKDKKKELMAATTAAAPAARVPEQAPQQSPQQVPLDERDAARRLSLVAESQPGPLQRQPHGRRGGAGGALGAGSEVQPVSSEPSTDQAMDLGSEELQAPLETPKQTGTPREQPARDPVVGAATSATHAYTVRSNDTLSEIAQRELGSARRWQEITAANPGLDPARLQAGKTIQIPGAKASSQGARTAAAPDTRAEAPKAKAPAGDTRTWKVGKGENLWKIAERALGDGKRWPEIAALNPRANPDRLVTGQVLTLPGAKTASAKKPTTTAKRESANAELVASNVGDRAQGRGKVK